MQMSMGEKIEVPCTREDPLVPGCGLSFGVTVTLIKHVFCAGNVHCLIFTTAYY